MSILWFNDKAWTEEQKLEIKGMTISPLKQRVIDLTEEVWALQKKCSQLLGGTNMYNPPQTDPGKPATVGTTYCEICDDTTDMQMHWDEGALRISGSHLHWRDSTYTIDLPDTNIWLTEDAGKQQLRTIMQAIDKEDIGEQHKASDS